MWLGFWVQNIKVEATQERTYPSSSSSFCPLLRHLGRFVYLPLNLEPGERTPAVIGIRDPTGFQYSLFLGWSMLSILSYSVLFLLLLFPLLFILSFLLFFMVASLFLIFMSVLFYFLFWFPIVVLFLVTALLLLRLLMFLSIFLSPPLILLISDMLLWSVWPSAESYDVACSDAIKNCLEKKAK